MNFTPAKNLLYLVSLVGLYAISMNYSFGSGNIDQPASKHATKKFKIRVTNLKRFSSAPEATILAKNNDNDIQLGFLFNKDSYNALNNNVPSELLTFNKEKYTRVIKGSVQKNTDASSKNRKKRVHNISLAKLRNKNKSFVNLTSGSVQTEEEAQNDYKALIDDARVFIERGDVYKAEKNLERAMAYSANNVWNLAEIAGNFEKISRYQFASKAYKKALSKKPNRIELLFSYAVCLRKDNKLDKSKEVLKQLIEISPGFMLAHFNLGSIYYKKAMYYNSLESFYRSVKLNPLSIDAYYNIAHILEKLNERNLAKKYYAKCIKLNPKDKQSKNAILRLGKAI